MIPTRESIRRRVMKWLICRVCKWDRLFVVQFALESMGHQQRTDALGYILCKYFPKKHLHANPRKKVVE